MKSGLAFALLVWLPVACPAAQAAPDFVKDVQPIFQRSCYGCHGPEKQKNGYRLDAREIAIKGGKSGEPAMVPHDADKSLLIRYVNGEDEEMVMPPKKSDKPRLTAKEISTLRAWIDAGPAWPDELAGAAETKAHWSLEPLVKPEPAAAGGNLSGNPIDIFIAAKLAEKGLVVSPEADARTLIRRVSYDLAGLPPTPEEVDAFLRETHEPNSSESYARLVARLLASPRYGEHWARHWLDVAHYADTHGNDHDHARPNAWPYRDYVIRAFNEDKTYARFVQEQVAGDALFANEPQATVALARASAIYSTTSPSLSRATDKSLIPAPARGWRPASARPVR